MMDLCMLPEGVNLISNDVKMFVAKPKGYTGPLRLPVIECSFALSREFDIFLVLYQLQISNIFKNLNYGMPTEKK